MKRSNLILFLAIPVAVACVWVARPRQVDAAQVHAAKLPAVLARAAVAFDESAPLADMEQFIPDKPVVIHQAVESVPERQGATQGPGAGLGTTPPAPPAARRPGPARTPPPIPPRPAAPEINAAAAAIEQTTQGKRAAIPANST